jgi:hypothetical protein
MDHIAMLFLCLAIGIALRKFRRIPDNAHTTINAFIINVSPYLGWRRQNAANGGRLELRHAASLSRI